MTNPLEIKMKLDENGDIISAHKSNDSFNQYIQETKQNVLIYLSMIEPNLTKDFILKELTEENKENLSSTNLNKINSLCWSAGVISDTMNKNIENELFIPLFKLLMIMSQKAEGHVSEIISYNLIKKLKKLSFLFFKYLIFLKGFSEF